jgi:hypothetical protein
VGRPFFAEGVQWEPAIILFGLPPFLQRAAADAILYAQVILRALLAQNYEPDQVEEFMGLCYLHQEEYRQRPPGKGKAAGSGKYQSHRVVHLEVATTEGEHDGTVAAIRQAFHGFETSPKVFLPVFSRGFRFYAVAKLGNIPNPLPYAHQGHKGDYLHPEQCVTLLSTAIPLRGVKAARAGQTIGALLTQCGGVRGQNLLAIGCMDDRFFINVAEAADARSIQTFMMKCQSTLRLVHQARVLGWEVQIEGD